LIKRTFSDRTTISPSISPKKKKPKVSSAISIALEKPAHGLLNFFKRCSPEEYQAQMSRAHAEEKERWEELREKMADVKKKRAERTKAVNRERQQRYREKVRENEIETGKRSPGGTKHVERKVCTHHTSLCLCLNIPICSVEWLSLKICVH
jgi:hypothetical protein